MDAKGSLPGNWSVSGTRSPVEEYGALLVCLNGNQGLLVWLKKLERVRLGRRGCCEEHPSVNL